jgi:L-amino acid N-acyltransferase YncA
MKIIQLKPGDETLLRRAEAVFDTHPPTLERAAFLLREPTYVMVVALDDEGEVMGRIYGHVLHRFESTDFLIYAVDTDQGHQRKGAGRAMLDYLRTMAVHRGWHEMWVLTDLDNQAGNGLYKSAGGILENSPANMYVFYTKP